VIVDGLVQLTLSALGGTFKNNPKIMRFYNFKLLISDLPIMEQISNKMPS
jgi:hypothetical protein